MRFCSTGLPIDFTNRNPYIWQMQTINQIVQDLVTSGLTQKELGEYAGVSQPVISELQRGIQKDIGYSHGKKLETLHKERFPELYKPKGKIERRTTQA